MASKLEVGERSGQEATAILGKELSRKAFVSGGALIVGLSLAGAAQAANDPKAASPTHTGLNPGPPDARQIDSWIAIHADNTATLYSGRVNLGQGSPNGLLMIAGEELDMAMAQLKWVDADSNVTPGLRRTVGSSSIRTAGPQVRAAAASAKQALLGLAATQPRRPRREPVREGRRRLRRRQDRHLRRADRRQALQRARPSPRTSTRASRRPSRSTQYKLVGTSPPRIDIPDKVTGKFTYVHSVRAPGMLHARVVRPRGQGSYGVGTKVLSVDESSIKNIPERPGRAQERLHRRRLPTRNTTRSARPRSSR